MPALPASDARAPGGGRSHPCERRCSIDSLYGESHALVIGVSDYEHRQSLPGVKQDVTEVE